MKIEEQVIDIDGSCRDVNFPDVDIMQAIALLNHVLGFCELNSASDSEGNKLSAEEISNQLSKSDAETIVSYWKCQGLISQVQLFLSWNNKSKIFIELTFFPQDVDKEAYSLEKFKEWLKPFLVALNTKTYFVRYENASWLYGDTNEFSGVIFSSSPHENNSYQAPPVDCQKRRDF